MTTETETKTTHTALPWRVERLHGASNDFGRWFGISGDPQNGEEKRHYVADVCGKHAHDDANAKYIVRACNSHHALLAACEEVSEAGRTANVMQMARAIATARAAIRAAKGGE